MSDPTAVDHTDALTIRMIDAIDALPVPSAPSGLRPRRTAVALLDPRPILVLMVIALATVLATPAGRAAAADAARWIQRLTGTASWSAYYADFSARDVAGVPAWRLMYAQGSFPGAPTRPEIVSVRLRYEPGDVPAAWSADGELFAIGAGSKIDVVDRAGRAREVANAGAGNNIQEIAWTGRGRISAVAREVDRDVVIAVDLATGSTGRHPLPSGIRIDTSRSGVSGTFSADGRWVIVPLHLSLGCHAVDVYDLKNDRLIRVIDGVTRRGRPIGWLPDSRLAWATCDTAADAPSSESRALNVVVSAPDGTGATAVGTIPQHSSGDSPVVDSAHDRILFTSGAVDDPDNAVWALGLDGGVTEIVRLPDVRRLAPDPAFQRVIHLGTVSRDGRLLAFSFTYVPGLADDPASHSRAGTIDLTTGVVTFACNDDCAGLQVR